MRRCAARASLRPRRFLCTASSSPREPLLPKWGLFGKSADDVANLEQKVRDDGDRQAAVTKQLAEIALKFQAMVTRPAQWFGYALAQHPLSRACATMHAL